MFRRRELKDIKTLSSLNLGESGKIVKIRGKAAEHYYLFEKGLTVGKSIAIENAKSSPEESMVMVRTGNKISEIQKKLALNVFVQVPRVLEAKKIPDMEKEYVPVYYDR